MVFAISHAFLQEYWWLMISILGSLLVFLMFVQGGQSFIYTLGSEESERTMILNAMGRKWEFTFTTLVTFGGAFFASFPLFYSTSFGGAYWVWIAILFSFVIQAISYEYRSKPSNILGKRTFELFLFINGALGPLLIGIAVGTFFTGSRFFVDEMNFSRWENGWHGLEAVLNFRNLALGFTVLFLSRLLGLMYIVNAIEDKQLDLASRKAAIPNSVLFLTAFLFFAVSLLVAEGFAVDADGTVFMERYKYLHNFLDMPLVLIFFLSGVIMILWSLYRLIFTTSVSPVWFGGTGTILVVLALFLIAGYNNTSFYPSVSDLQSSLTIRNASSSHFTLNIMMYVSFFIPFIAAYIWYAWRAVNSRPIDRGEMEGKGGAHIY
jgi:cytochrome d ubiquinol oxidase subunit II